MSRLRTNRQRLSNLMIKTLGPYELDSIVTGDARELAKTIPDNSIDLIFTDPIYDQIEDYKWLAKMAIQVLKDEGHLLVWQNVRNIFKTYQILKPLYFRYVFSLTRSNACRGTNNAFVYGLWTPLLWFSKKDKVYPPIKPRDSMDVPMIAGDKSVHKWQKPTKALSYWLRCFAKEKSVVFDPFSGSGSIPVVCKQLNRKYLAFEIDPENADVARQRVANTQPPLPLIMYEQTSILG